MSIAATVQAYLFDHQVRYDVVLHPHSSSSMASARAAQVPGDRLAKAVVLRDEDDHTMMAVLAATHHINLDVLRRDLQKRLHLVTESELEPLFRDCARGALPSLGEAYGLPVVLDESLMVQPDVYVEAGDHEALIHLSAGAFHRLMRSAARMQFGVRH
jgi:Ala-tRNA(Pro) deacylase